MQNIMFNDNQLWWICTIIWYQNQVRPGSRNMKVYTIAVSRGVCPTLLVLLAKTRFVLFDVILRAAHSPLQPSSFTSQTGNNGMDFSLIQNGPLSFRFAIAILDIMDANTGESYPVRCSCETLAARYRFYLFRNVSRNTFEAFPFFRLPRVPYDVRVQPR